jgi:hypothetical protein
MNELIRINGELDKTPYPCRRCGKNMRNPKTGATYHGFTAQLIDDQKDPETSAFLKEQVGDLVVGETYAFCFECLVKTFMGVK